MSGIVVLIIRILLTAALYAFLGWALYTLYRELSVQSKLISEQNIPAISFITLDEPGSDPQVYQLNEIFIGRDPSCNLILSDDTVSARHARFSYKQNQWWIEDLNSTNGTYINDEPVTTRVVIISGDEIRCGQSVLQVSIAGRK